VFLFFYGFMVLWFYGFMVLWFYGFMVLWFYGFMVLWFYDFMIFCFGGRIRERLCVSCVSLIRRQWWGGGCGEEERALFSFLLLCVRPSVSWKGCPLGAGKKNPDRHFSVPAEETTGDHQGKWYLVVIGHNDSNSNSSSSSNNSAANRLRARS
jgi:hypothetical protein